MKGRKIIIYVVVILLVAVLCIVFLNVFDFEKDEKVNKTTPEVTEELIHQLYSYIPKNEMGLHTMYTGNYNTINNISNDIVQSMIYEYIENYDQFQLEYTTIDELVSEDILLSTEQVADITPLYKVKVDVFKEAFPLIFGQEESFRIADFRYNYDTVAKINPTADYYYIYHNAPLSTDKNDVVFRDITKYAVTDEGQTIEIYDYYLKCDLNTNNCYDNEDKTKMNNLVKYSTNFDINSVIDNLAVYKHSFKYEDGYYYWYSSEQS